MERHQSTISGNAPQELYRLGYLLCGDSVTSIEAVADVLEDVSPDTPFFSDWMLCWSRKIFLAKVLAGVRSELKASALRTEMRNAETHPAISFPWSPDVIGKDQLERAMLAIDIFPRCALILTVYEKLPLEDVCVLLDAEKDVVESARNLGLQDLVYRLSWGQGEQLAA